MLFEESPGKKPRRIPKTDATSSKPNPRLERPTVLVTTFAGTAPAGRPRAAPPWKLREQVLRSASCPMPGVGPRGRKNQGHQVQHPPRVVHLYQGFEPFRVLTTLGGCWLALDLDSTLPQTMGSSQKASGSFQRNLLSEGV